MKKKRNKYSKFLMHITISFKYIGCAQKISYKNTFCSHTYTNFINFNQNLFEYILSPYIVFIALVMQNLYTKGVESRIDTNTTV